MRASCGWLCCLLALGVLLGACRETAHGPDAPGEARSVYLVSHGWHAGLVLRRADVPPALWPEQQDFPAAAFLEVGWGDSAYYRAPDPGTGTLLKAGLWPTPSVLHVVGLRRPVAASFPQSEIIRVEVTAAGLAAMAAYIHAAYAREADGRAMPLGPGLYGESLFYRGRERYHVFKNCNTWAARTLRAAGCPIKPAGILTVGDLLARVRAFGEVVQEAAE